MCMQGRMCSLPLFYPQCMQIHTHSTRAHFKEAPCVCAQFWGGLLGNALSLSSFTHAHERREAAVAGGWRQSWNVDGLDVLQNASGMHFLALVILEAALIRIFKGQKPEHSTEIMKTNRLECNPTPVLPQCGHPSGVIIHVVYLLHCSPT